MESLASEKAGTSSELLLRSSAESARCKESATRRESLRARAAESRTVWRTVLGTALLNTWRCPLRPTVWAFREKADSVNSSPIYTNRLKQFKLPIFLLNFAIYKNSNNS